MRPKALRYSYCRRNRGEPEINHALVNPHPVKKIPLIQFAGSVSTSGTVLSKGGSIFLNGFLNLQFFALILQGTCRPQRTWWWLGRWLPIATRKDFSFALVICVCDTCGYDKMHLLIQHIWLMQLRYLWRCPLDWRRKTLLNRQNCFSTSSTFSSF